MIANCTFKYKPPVFWAYVRTLSQQLGYSVRGQGIIKVPSLQEIKLALTQLGLDPFRCVTSDNTPTPLGGSLQDYFEYRASVLMNSVRHNLMVAEEAQCEFNKLHQELRHDVPLPTNKQKGSKKAYAYFTGIVNMLIVRGLNGEPCDYSPNKLTTISRDGMPLRTLSRRLDGAFPSVVNPVAVWEIKEYYYTTTFGSRVADGVYETLLDGMELLELRRSEGIHVRHYLMVDAYGTWWAKGKSYLCRMVDMLHMGYVDEILFGKEVLQRLPELTREWLDNTPNTSLESDPVGQE